jgi:polar amino acid transport system permease protein
MPELFAEWSGLLPGYLDGLLVSIWLTGCVMALGYPAGLLLALAHSSRALLIRALARVLIEVGRGVPALVTLYLVYFGLPQLDFRPSSMVAATLALAFTTSGYTSAIFESGLRSIDHGQREAARSLGLGPVKSTALVVLPQALRNVVIPLAGWSVLVFQATSLAFTIAVPEVTSRAYAEASLSYDYTTPLSLLGLLYAGVVLFLLAMLKGGSRLWQAFSARSWGLRTQT